MSSTRDELSERADVQTVQQCVPVDGFYVLKCQCTPKDWFTFGSLGHFRLHCGNNVRSMGTKRKAAQRGAR